MTACSYLKTAGNQTQQVTTYLNGSKANALYQPLAQFNLMSSTTHLTQAPTKDAMLNPNTMDSTPVHRTALK